MRDFEDEGWEIQDDGCLECGTGNYRKSRVPGVCDECLSSAVGSEVANTTRQLVVGCVPV